MASDSTQHGRRPHGHRRRGHDRRGGDRRPRPPQQDESAREREREPRDRPDVEQIMRDIRARIAERKGIDLSNQQIQDLAARRLEAILDPEGLDPALMERLRRAAGSAPVRAPEPEPVESFDEASLYESSNGLVRALRGLFRPLLSLLINPGALAGALTSQARSNATRAAREAEHQRRQTEWNALHYEILRRLVTDAARAEIERRDLLLRVESLAARVEFNDKRVATVEQAQHQVRAPRGADAPAATTDGGERGEQPSRAEAEGEGGRRRRRRRRGRRTGGFQPDGPGTEAEGDVAGEAPEAGEPSEERADDQVTTGSSWGAPDAPVSDVPAASPAPAPPASPPDDAPAAWPAPDVAAPRSDAASPAEPPEPAEPTRREQAPAPPSEPGSDPSATDR